MSGPRLPIVAWMRRTTLRVASSRAGAGFDAPSQASGAWQRLSAVAPGRRTIRKWLLMAVCAVSLSLPSGKAESLEPVTTFALIAAGAKVVDYGLSYLEKGANPNALQVKQTYEMLTELHGRLNGYDKILTKMSSDMANLPDTLRKALDDSELRARQDAVMAMVKFIMLDVKTKLDKNLPVADAQDRLQRLQFSAQHLMEHNSDWSFPYIGMAMATELNFLKSLEFPEYSDDVADVHIEYRRLMYVGRLQEMLDVDRPGSLAREYALYSRNAYTLSRKIRDILNAARDIAADTGYLRYLSSSKYYDGFPNVPLMDDIESWVRRDPFPFFFFCSSNARNTRAFDSMRLSREHCRSIDWSRMRPSAQVRSSRSTATPPYWAEFSCGTENSTYLDVFVPNLGVLGIMGDIRDHYRNNYPQQTLSEFISKMLWNRLDRPRPIPTSDMFSLGTYLDWLFYGENPWTHRESPRSRYPEWTRRFERKVRVSLGVILPPARIQEQCRICMELKILYSNLLRKDGMRGLDSLAESRYRAEITEFMSLGSSMLDAIRKVEELIGIGHRGDLHYSLGRSCRANVFTLGLLTGREQSIGRDCVRRGQVLTNLRSALKILNDAILRFCARPRA